MLFTIANSILVVKKLSSTQTQAIGYTHIPSNLYLAFGLCISLVVFKNHFKIVMLVITMVKYVFVVTASILLVKNLSPTQTIGYTNIPSDLHLAL